MFCWIAGKADCYKAITALGMDEKVIENLARHFSRALPEWFGLIDNFLPDGQKRQYKKSSCAAW